MSSAILGDCECIAKHPPGEPMTSLANKGSDSPPSTGLLDDSFHKQPGVSGVSLDGSPVAKTSPGKEEDVDDGSVDGEASDDEDEDDDEDNDSSSDESDDSHEGYDNLYQVGEYTAASQPHDLNFSIEGNLNHFTCPRCHPHEASRLRPKLREREPRKKRKRARVEPFQFMNLPVEVRLLVYSHLFYCGQFFIVNSTNRRHAWHMRRKDPTWLDRTTYTTARELIATYVLGEGLKDLQFEPAEVSILRTCRQIYEESLPVFYSVNTFNFYDIECMVPFFQDITRPARRAVRKVILCYQNPMDWVEVELHEEWNKTPLDEYHINRWGRACKYLSKWVNISDLTVHVLNYTTNYDSQRNENWEKAMLEGAGPYASWIQSLYRIKTVQRFVMTNFMEYEDHLDQSMIAQTIHDRLLRQTKERKIQVMRQTSQGQTA